MRDKNDKPPGAPRARPAYRGERIYFMAAGGTALLAIAGIFLAFDFLYRHVLAAVLQLATAALLLGFAFKLETGRERAARRTRELEEKDAHIAALVDNVADPIVGMDAKGTIRSFNPAAEKAFGFSAVEAVGKSVALLMPEPHKSRHPEYVERYLRTGQARVLGIGCQIAALRRDGSTFPADLTVGETRLGGRREFIGIIRDVSERKRAEDALRMKSEIVDRIHDAVNSTDMDGYIRTWNKGSERLFGYTEEEALGKHISILYAREDRLCLEKEIIAPLKEKGRLQVEARAIAKSGKTVYVHLLLSVIYDASGFPAGMMGCATDITERKEAEEALRKSEEDFRKIFDNSPAGIAMAGLDQKFIGANKTLIDMLGYGEQELRQLTVADVAFPRDVEGYRQCAEAMVRGERESCRSEKRFIRKNGEIVWCNLGAALLKDANHTPVFFLIMLEDITQRKLAEEKLQLYREHLEDLVKERTEAYTSVNEELEAFNFSVSHDLRAPLRRISGLIEIAREEHSGEMDPAAKALLERIDLSCNHMKRLIEDLLRLSQLNLAALDPARVDLSRQAREIVEELKETHPERQVDVFIEEGVEVTGDNSLLGVALENLLGNAWKYTQKRDGARIEFGRAPHNGDDCFYVRDNGVGFDMEYAGQLFAPFRRLHSEDEFPGTGIGLCTVLRIVRRHKGRIWAEAAPEKGAVFYFSLPGQKKEKFLGGLPQEMGPMDLF